MPYEVALRDLTLLDPHLDMGGIGLPQNEVPLYGPGSIVLAGSGVTITNGSRWVDTPLVPVVSRIKSLIVIVDTAITSGAAQQATLQLFAARTIFGVLGTPSARPSAPFAGAQSAGSSQIPSGTAPNSSQLIGSPVNFAGSVASIPQGVYWFSATSPGNPSASPPTSMTELAQEYPCLGVELTAPAAFTGGAFRAFFEVAPL